MSDPREQHTIDINTLPVATVSIGELNKVFSDFNRAYEDSYKRFARPRSMDDYTFADLTLKNFPRKETGHDGDYIYPHFMRHFLGDGIVHSYHTVDKLQKAQGGPPGEIDLDKYSVRVGKALSGFHMIMRNAGKTWGVAFDKDALKDRDPELLKMINWMEKIDGPGSMPPPDKIARPEGDPITVLRRPVSDKIEVPPERPESLKGMSAEEISNEVMRRFAALETLPLRFKSGKELKKPAKDSGVGAVSTEQVDSSGAEAMPARHKDGKELLKEGKYIATPGEDPQRPGGYVRYEVPNEKIEVKRTEYYEADAVTRTHHVPVAALMWAVRPAGMNIQGRPETSPMRHFLQQAMGIGDEAGRKMKLLPEIISKHAPELALDYNRIAIAHALLENKKWIKVAASAERLMGRSGEGYKQVLGLINEDPNKIDFISATKIAVLLYAVTDRLDKEKGNLQPSRCDETDPSADTLVKKEALRRLASNAPNGMSYDDTIYIVRELTEAMAVIGIDTEKHLEAAKILERSHRHDPDFYEKALASVFKEQEPRLHKLFTEHPEYVQAANALAHFAQVSKAPMKLDDYFTDTLAHMVQSCTRHEEGKGHSGLVKQPEEGYMPDVASERAVKRHHQP